MKSRADPRVPRVLDMHGSPLPSLGMPGAELPCVLGE